MKTQEFVDVRVGESTQPDHGYELSDKCIITKSSNAVASGAGSKGLFSYKSTKLKSAECKINQSLRDASPLLSRSKMNILPFTCALDGSN